MSAVGNGCDHIRCRRQAELERRAGGARLPQGRTVEINYTSTLLLMLDVDFMILAFPMPARGVLAFTWLRR
jgi:hypothetical protein